MGNERNLSLTAWTPPAKRRSTVQGELEGPSDRVEKMKTWLCQEGSPMSHVERCEFEEERNVDAYTYPSFVVRPTKDE